MNAMSWEWWLLIAFALVVLSYAMSRAASLAYYRTKLEYFRSVMKHEEGDGRHGKE
jgi:hypothetical protein